MLGRREYAHVGPDLRHDHLRGAPLNPGDRAQQLNGSLERGDLLPDRLGEARDLLVEEVDVGEDRPDPDGVQSVEAALERLPERRQLGAQAALGELGQQLGIGRARDQCVEHRPARDAEDVGRDAVELDPGVLERLVEAIGLARALGDLRLAIAGEVALRADRLGRHEARLEQARLEQLAHPGGVGDVGLSARWSAPVLLDT